MRKPLKLRFGLVALVIACTACGLLVHIPWSGRVATATFDLMHTPLFCVVCLILLWLLASPKPGKATIGRILIAVVLVGLSALAEYVQQFVGRDSNIGDLLANMIGVASGFLFFEWFVRRTTTPGRIAAFAGLLLFVAGLTPAIRLYLDCVRERMEFPLVDSFEYGRQRWFNSRSTVAVLHDPKLASHGQNVVQWHIHVAKFPNIRMFDPLPDWTGYRYLEFDMWLPEKSAMDDLAVTVKLQDRLTRQKPYQQRHEDRFQQDVNVSRSNRHFKIDLADVEDAPATRTMDLRKIALLEFFVDKLEEPVTVYIDHIRLTKSDNAE